MQPRRQAGSADSTGGGAPRRSLMNPFVPQAGPHQGPQPQPPPMSFLQYPIPMETSIRSYNPPPQQQMPGRYWQTPASMEPPPTSSYGKQGRHHGGSLDLGEFSDILGTNASRGGAPGGTSSEASEMSMASFEVGSFHDGMARSSIEDSDGFHSGVAAAAGATMQARLPASATELVPARLRKSTKTAAAPSDEDTKHLVDAAYTVSESQDDPKLKVNTLAKDQNERCQFHGCPNRARVAQAYGNFCNRHVIVAPCGFPGCRDKAMERAAMCVKHMEQGKEALQKILDARSQSVPVCRTAGCFKNDQGRGYCRGHEKLLMATGRLPAHVSKRRLNGAYTMCSYPECTRHSQRHHLCRTHGNLIVNQARELADRPGATESYDEILGRMQKDIRRCTHENCTKNSQRDRLCTMHYYEKHNLQKDSSAPVDAASASSTTPLNESLGSRQQGMGNSDGSDVRGVERTGCGKPGCGNLSYTAGLCVQHTKENQDLIHSQGRYCEPFSSGDNGGMLAADIENEEKPGLFTISGKQQSIGVSGSSAIATSMNSVTTTCSNPMCDRESYGRDYCEMCQKLFSPLVVSIGEIPSGSHGYTFNSANAPIVQPEENVSLCRVGNCGQESVTGGLCATHFRAFETGSLSVDQVKLNSHAQQRQQELAEAAAAAAAAVETKQASPAAPGKARKYYCRVEGCGKQAQKRNLCKRHFRQQDASAGKSQPEIRPSGLPSDYVLGVQPTEFSPPTLACRFPGCSQFTSSGALLCLTHSKATFCWHPGCENLVGHQQFCEFHAFRKQCAYEGCLYTAQLNRSGCAHHAMSRRCCHEFCDKFAVGSDSDWCRLHQISCQDSPCVLCRLHAPSLDGLTAGEDENSSRSRYNANLSILATREIPEGGFSGGSPFSRNPRLM